MKAVGIRELKSRLSEYLRLVRSGEEVWVTDRGEVVAELRPPSRAAADVPYPALLRLAREGKARLGAPLHAGLYPRLPSAVPKGEVARLLAEERGER
jgi:antitoxin (DNA-binding transcriptional repressor) of toxin-antitoxin stability system